MRAVVLDFAFRAQYSLKVISGKPEDKGIIVSLGSTGDFEETAILDGSLTIDTCYLRVQPSNGKPWFLDLYGDIENKQVEGIYGCPNPDFFLAVIDSVAYYINSSFPLQSKVIRCQPVRQVISYPGYDLLLVLDFVAMTAVGTSGILWTTNRLVRDELKVLEISDEKIFCAGNYRTYNSGNNDIVSIDRHDGRILSGNIFSE